MPPENFAHVGDLFQSGSSGVVPLVALCCGLFTLVIVIEHLGVKHRRAFGRSVQKPVAAVVSIALAAVIAPAPAHAQDLQPAVGLPDLISDPPFIWFEKHVESATGEPLRVLAFDGYIHNIGDGALDVFGNPQLEDGMKQRVFDGDEWSEVGTPTVRFETTDGHNHFHLIEAVDYALWNDARTEQVNEASKIGFCLVDTEQRTERYDSFYGIDTFNYCGVEDPTTTELRMGITPGWTDTYDANTTLQWVDITNVQPGRYWVSAITDPNDEIVESDETNNGLVFSRNRFSVAGYVAREIPDQQSSEPIELRSDAYGIAGEQAFVIDQAPRNGRLNVPTGVALFDPVVSYTPNPGFEGADTFTFFTRDITSSYPLDPRRVEVTVEVDSAGIAPATRSDSTAAEIVMPDQISHPLWQPVSVPLELRADGPADVHWYGADLPPGLRVDRDTGVISGVAQRTGQWDPTIAVVVDGVEVRRSFRLDIIDSDEPTLTPTNSIWSAPEDVLRRRLGNGRSDASYAGTGNPEGTTFIENLPILAGNPTELGSFDIEMSEIVDGETVDRITFTWHVRPSATPSFVL